MLTVHNIVHGWRMRWKLAYPGKREQPLLINLFLFFSWNKYTLPWEQGLCAVYLLMFLCTGCVLYTVIFFHRSRNRKYVKFCFLKEMGSPILANSLWGDAAMPTWHHLYPTKGILASGDLLVLREHLVPCHSAIPCWLPGLLGLLATIYVDPG